MDAVLRQRSWGHSQSSEGKVWNWIEKNSVSRTGMTASRIERDGNIVLVAKSPSDSGSWRIKYYTL